MCIHKCLYIIDFYNIIHEIKILPIKLQKVIDHGKICIIA